MISWLNQNHLQFVALSVRNYSQNSYAKAGKNTRQLLPVAIIQRRTEQTSTHRWIYHIYFLTIFNQNCQQRRKEAATIIIKKYHSRCCTRKYAIFKCYTHAMPQYSLIMHSKIPTKRTHTRKKNNTQNRIVQFLQHPITLDRI